MLKSSTIDQYLISIDKSGHDAQKQSSPSQTATRKTKTCANFDNNGAPGITKRRKITSTATASETENRTSKFDDDMFNNTITCTIEKLPGADKIYASDFVLNKRHITAEKTEYHQTAAQGTSKDFYKIPVWKQKINEIRAALNNNNSNNKANVPGTPKVILSQEILEHSQYYKLLKNLREHRHNYTECRNKYKNKEVTKDEVLKCRKAYEEAESDFKTELLRLKDQELKKSNGTLTH